MQCEASFFDTKVNCLKMEDILVKANQEIMMLRIERKIVFKQLEDMKIIVGGKSFWPKPIIHPFTNSDDLTYIATKPYGFCNRAYHWYDVAVTSCKHTFHPFCLGEMLRINNRCTSFAPKLVVEFGFLRGGKGDKKTWSWYMYKPIICFPLFLFYWVIVEL